MVFTCETIFLSQEFVIRSAFHEERSGSETFDLGRCCEKLHCKTFCCMKTDDFCDPNGKPEEKSDCSYGECRN